MQGKLRTVNSISPANMELTLGALRFRSIYKIIDTNYIDYAAVWSCYESPLLAGTLGHTENLWILSRQILLKPEYLNKMFDVIDSLNISRATLIDTNFNNCTDISGRLNSKLSSHF
ncbi:apolipoprotein D-like [Centruroides vittatus]|uniref:apolipoprotein D-like n=1 Tax=Centruroides vittatus TaxID=120091 RepID=UPI0035107D73